MNSKNEHKIAVVVLNYRGWEDTIECLESLQMMDYRDFLMVVVDNGSHNKSVHRIKEWAKGHHKVESEFIEYSSSNKPVFVSEYSREEAERGGIAEKEQKLESIPNNLKLVMINCNINLGFSGGNNVGAKYAVERGFHYIVLLNNDTVVIDRDFLNKTVKVFESQKSCCVVGPKIVDLVSNFDGPYIYETFWGELFLLTLKNFLRKIAGCPQIYIDLEAISSPRPVPVYKISGACMTFTAHFLKEIGYLDENVWLSCEEAIVAEKVLAKDKKIYFQPHTLLIHKKAQSPRNDKSRFDILKNHFLQRRYFLRQYKNYGPLKMSLIRTVHALRLFIEKLR